MTGNVVAVLLGYLIGAIPLGLVLGKMLKGVDIRDYGSGKIGMANVLRTVGVKAAVAVFLFDLGKGVAAVFIAKGLGDATYVEVLAAGAAFAGHNWSVFIRFTGGRGVNTGLGGFFAMAPLWAAGAIGTGVVIIGLSRYVSLGSLAGATFGLVALLVL
ncbi:MAG: glycerol-3-phosphate acyltransferase, partial [Dehalococcoidia bacterium]